MIWYYGATYAIAHEYCVARSLGSEHGWDRTASAFRCQPGAKIFSLLPVKNIWKS